MWRPFDFYSIRIFHHVLTSPSPTNPIPCILSQSVANSQSKTRIIRTFNSQPHIPLRYIILGRAHSGVEQNREKPNNSFWILRLRLLRPPGCCVMKSCIRKYIRKRTCIRKRNKSDHDQDQNKQGMNKKGKKILDDGFGTRIKQLYKQHDRIRTRIIQQYKQHDRTII